jgi:phosphoglycerate kinase
MAKLTIEDLDLAQKSLVMRVDFNVPLDGDVITDDNRIAQAMPSIKYAVGKGAKVILLSHLGRPKGEADPAFSLKPVFKYLKENLETNVFFGEDCVGDKANAAISEADFGDVVLLENVRFHAGEKKNDPEFSKELAELGDIFVNDAFGSSHRAHSSVVGVTEFLQPAAAGYLLEKEIKYLEGSVNDPDRPFVAVLGGAKVSDKIGVIENLLDKVDDIIVGGGMTYTFYKAKGLPIGNSLIEEDKVELAVKLIEQAKIKGVNLHLPVDSVVAKEFKADAESKVVGEDGIEDGWMALDIGPESVKAFSDVIKRSKTVIWNGPMGVFEMEQFSKGTFAVAGALADVTKEGATTIIGGGDSASAIKKAGLSDKVTHVSTGGGASLEYLEGKELPGIAALTEK